MDLVCIVCPNSCKLSINKETLEVTGNKCKRGEAFAKAEITNPVRTITTTVKTVFDDYKVIPVKVSGEIPKDKIFDCMKEINKVTVTKKLNVGDVIIKNILGLNVDIVSTITMED